MLEGRWYGTIEGFDMASHGKKFDFHGSFARKEDAVKKESEVHGFIREHKIGGHVRYFVLTERK